VEEALVPLRLFWNLITGQKRQELLRQAHGVDHFPFGGTGVDVLPVQVYDRLRGVKALVIDAAGAASVHRVAEIHAESHRVKVQHPLAHFLIRRKCNTDFSVGQFGAFHIFSGHAHKDGDARLVVRA